MSDAVQQIKERLSIVDVVSPYVKLTKAGRSWRGLSPFNKEKTPSFFVSPDRGFYHCFSSGKGGDMFTFIQEMEGVDFRGALKMLAEKAGVELVPENPKVRDERERGLAALAQASAFFVHELDRNADARGYLMSRGLSEQSMRAWKLGYARDEWRVLSDYLRHEGFTDDEIEKAGLAKYPESGEGRAESGEQDASNSSHPSTLTPQRSAAPKARLYDRFRGRIMFPISDTSGRVVAFSGRTFGASQKDAAKYLNSPETAFFDKSRVLHGLDRAKESMRKVNFAILVEGQMDLLLSHQAGFTNAVATSGTALTPEHLELISRITKNIVVAYDGDRAGVAAALRASGLALQAKLNVKVAALPEGKDPADIIKEDSDTWRAVIRSATHPVEYLLTRLRHEYADERAYRLAAREEILPLLARIGSPIDRAHFAGVVAARLSLTESAVLEELAQLSRTLADPVLGVVEANVARDILPRAEAIRERLIASRAFFKDDTARAQDILQRLSSLIGEEAAKEELPASRLSELLFEFERVESADHAAAEVEALFEALRPLLAREAYERAMRELKDAEAAGETARAKEIMGRLNDLRRGLES